MTEILVETQCHLYKKSIVLKGTCLQHAKRACCPLMVWKSANRSDTIIIVLSENGWEIYNRIYMPVRTAEEISPEDLISLVSCNCNGDCSNGHCTCKNNYVACTDSCGSLVRILIRDHLNVLAQTKKNRRRKTGRKRRRRRRRRRRRSRRRGRRRETKMN